MLPLFSIFLFVQSAVFLHNVFLKLRDVVTNYSSLCIGKINDDFDKQLIVCIHLKENYSNKFHAVSITSLLKDPLLRYSHC